MTLAQLFLLIRTAAGESAPEERRGTIEGLLEMQAMAARGGHRV